MDKKILIILIVVIIGIIFACIIFSGFLSVLFVNKQSTNLGNGNLEPQNILGQGSSEIQSNAAWASASPFSINSVKATGTNLQLSMTNNGLDDLTITSISGTGITTTAFTTGFSSGQNQVLTVTLAATCGAVGTLYQYDNVKITYNQGSLTGLYQIGVKPLAGKCT
ncbi:MAG: hypothetical protein Q7S22_06790 [Candidatus Micrarchaeota archaeon]|nr:hypothetical protein [Candidatus Micrarchaeota archaeon]